MNQVTLHRELAQTLAKVHGLLREDAIAMVNLLLGEIEAHLDKGRRVRFGSVFTLVPSRVRRRLRYDITSGVSKPVPAYRTVKLRLNATFAEAYRDGKAVAGPVRAAPPTAFKPTKKQTARSPRKKA